MRKLLALMAFTASHNTAGIVTGLLELRNVDCNRLKDYVGDKHPWTVANRRASAQARAYTGCLSTSAAKGHTRRCAFKSQSDTLIG